MVHDPVISRPNIYLIIRTVRYYTLTYYYIKVNLWFSIVCDVNFV